ncbi:hypothetical protein ACFQZC_03685 [Streptacidiphilus monticola]
MAVLVACLLTLAWRVRGSLRAASLGLAAATGFSLTAALIKQVTTDASADGVGRIFQQWPLYTAAAVGASSFALLQLTIRSGTLRASQPALTLGDAFLSVVLGRVLFGEHLALGLRLVPAALGAALVAAGVLGLSRGPGLAESWDDQAPQGQHDDRPSAPGRPPTTGTTTRTPTGTARGRRCQRRVPGRGFDMDVKPARAAGAGLLLAAAIQIVPAGSWLPDHAAAGSPGSPGWAIPDMWR